jgi:two-component system CheB/CheR fusion protein
MGVWSHLFHFLKSSGARRPASSLAGTIPVEAGALPSGPESAREMPAAEPAKPAKFEGTDELVSRQALALEEYARLLDYAPTLIRAMDGRIIFWNQGLEQLYGWTNAEAEGHTSHVLLKTEFPRPLEQIERELLRNGDWQGELVHSHRQGDRLITASHWILHRDDDGAPTAVLEISHDITELKKAEERLREADQRKDEFLAMLGHELRNPLAPIRNASQVLRLLGPQDGRLAWAQDIIERQLTHLTRLVDDLLDVSRITRGKVLLHPEVVDLEAMVARAVETSRPLLDARRHELTVDLPRGPIRLLGDPTRLAQVLANLLNNAAKYTPEGGQVGIAASVEQDEVVLRVRDDGIGIAPEVLPRIFDLFAQGERAVHRSQGGLGIGLTLVRGLVEMHGGVVEAFSEGMGRGSEFVVRLPLFCAPDPPAGLRAHGGDAGRLAPSRILVVDDNRDSADSVRALLELAGHEVRTAYDGPAALVMAGEFRPEVVFLDIGLPRMDGYEVARRLRMDPRLDHVTLIAMTGYGQEEDRRQSREAGFDHHFVKPMDPGVLGSLLASPASRLQRA